MVDEGVGRVVVVLEERVVCWEGVSWLGLIVRVWEWERKGGGGLGEHTSAAFEEAANCLRMAGEAAVLVRERMARGVMRDDMICGCERLLSGG